MLVLGINTATSKTAIALIEVGANIGAKKRIIFEKEWDSDYNEAEMLLPAIRHALKAGRPERLFVVKGPGAFTGLRIGVTAANTLAYVFNAPVAPVSTYDYLLARVPSSKRGSAAVILKAGGDFAAVTRATGKKTEASGKKVKRVHATDLPQIIKKMKGVKFAVGDMCAKDKKKYPLPQTVKWLSEKELRPLSRVMAEFLRGKISWQKSAMPKYLLPPKITKSKKPVF